MAAQRQFVKGYGICAAKHIFVHVDCGVTGEHHIVGERKGLPRFPRNAVDERVELGAIGQRDGIVSKGAERGGAAHHRAATQRRNSHTL